MSAVTEFNSSHKSIGHNPHPEYGYDDARETVPVGYVDFGEIDRRLAGNADDHDDHDDHAGNYRDAAEIMREVLTWACRPKPLRSKCVRFLALCAALRPELLNDRTYEAIGREYGLSKAGVSKCIMVFQREFRFKAARTRPESAREHMRQARLAQLPAKH